MTGPDIAVVLTAHAEGRVLVPTIRSLEIAIRRAVTAGLEVEVVAVADRVDPETQRVLDVHLLGRSDFPSRIILVDADNGDLGASRNDGIRATSAPFIAIMDGDNLVTSAWLVDARAVLLGQSVPSVAHVELIVSFGDRLTLWSQVPSDAADFDPSVFAVANYWDSSAVAHREVFESTPYPVLPPDRGFGPEDWVWNMATLEAGVPHVRIPHSALFYRARAGSLMSAHGSSLLPRVPFLTDLPRAQCVANGIRRAGARVTWRGRIREALPHRYRRPVSLALRAARSVLRPWVRGGRRVIQKVRGHEHVEMPEWLRDEWRAANGLEPSIPFPRPDTLDHYASWGAPWPASVQERARAYWRLLAAFKGSVDYLFVAPWVKTGGGDRVMTQYIEAVLRLDPHSRVALLTTEPDESPRMSDVPDGVVVVELRDLFSPHVDREWVVDALLPQLLTQLDVRTLHVFNSTVGFDVVERYGRLLSQTIAIFLSTFVTDRTPDGERTSVLYYRHSRFLSPTKAVLVDSAAFIDAMVEEGGFPRRKFRLQPQIVPELQPVMAHTDGFTPDRPLRLLWAGRFDLQKRLDILAQLARAVRERQLPVQIDFFGERVMGDPTLDRTLAALADAGAVRHDAFKNIAELGLDGFDAFVMTSEWEGVPNTLLEVMSSGLPVIAPTVGGISEVLDRTVGYPVGTFDEIDQYLGALEEIIADPSDAALRGRAGRRRVHARHSSEAFDQALVGLNDYIGGLRSRGDAALGGWTFAADERTRTFIESDSPRVYLFSGSGGYSNFGDILQPKNVLALWRRLAPEVEPVLFFHIGSVRSVERLEQMREWYGLDHIVFFSDDEHLDLDFVRPITDAAGSAGPVHVVGGGFLNSTWGVRYLSVIEAIGEAFATTEFLLSGMQIDEFIVPHLQSFAQRVELRAVGLRDDQSLALARGVFGDRAAASFDDLYESIEAWGAGRKDAVRTPGPFRLGLHINASEYVGGQAVIRAVGDALRAVLERYPDAELTLLNAYPDQREEVRDTVASLRLFGDEFPFSTYRVVDIAKAALESDIVRGDIPRDIASLELDAAITCSYHTTMLMNSLGVPAFLIRINEYYTQKAAIFALPDDFGVFLDTPDAYISDFSRQSAARTAWVERLASWMNGDGLPPAETSA